METMDPTFMHQPALTLSPRLLSLPASAWLPDLLLRKWQVPIQPPFASAETCTAPLFRPLLLPGPIPEPSGRPPSAAGRAHPPAPTWTPSPKLSALAWTTLVGSSCLPAPLPSQRRQFEGTTCWNPPWVGACGPTPASPSPHPGPDHRLLLQLDLCLCV